MKVEFNYNITPAWELIKKVESNTRDLFSIENEDLKTATLMVITELLENAIKYGRSNPEINGIAFNFFADAHKIQIKVANAVISDAHARQLISHINNLNEVGDPMALYTQRLIDMLKNKEHGKSRLGIYRIAYEGEFNLSYEFKNKILTVIAEKSY